MRFKFYTSATFCLWMLLAPISQSYAQYSVSSGGKKAWPPKGPSCDQLVRCCAVAEKKGSEINLLCQLSVSVNLVDCVKGLETVRGYLTERKLSVPSECLKE